MKTQLKSTLFVLALAGSVAGFAQFKLSGELIPRTEYRNGYQKLMDSLQEPGLFTAQRTRLNFGYKNEKVQTKVSLQDVRVWGSQSQLNTYDDKTSSLHEAWGEYSFTDKCSFKVGRQVISYNDQRILGGVDWALQARSHDAFVFKYADSTFTMHLGGAYNQAGGSNTGVAYTGVSNYKEMYYLWLNKKFNNLSISILELNNGIQSPIAVYSTRFSYTAGTHIEYKKDALFGSGRFYTQGGVDGGKKEIQAYMLGLDLQYTINKKFMLGLGMEMLSGQSQTDTTKAYGDVMHAFNSLYPTGHKFNGYMDYFYAGSGHGNVGLNDIYLVTKYKKEKWFAALDVHMFMANADVLDVKELTTNGTYKAMSSSLGTELDFTFNYKFNPEFSMQFGYSHLMATETMEAIKGGKYDMTQNWAYLMVVFKPSFIK